MRSSRTYPAMLLSLSVAALVRCVGDTATIVPVGDSGLPDTSVTDANNPADTSSGVDAADAADSAPPPTGNYLSSLVFPDVTIGGSVAFGPAGDAILAGDITDNVSTVSINSIGYSSKGSRDFLAIDVAANNGIKWVQTFGGTGDDRLMAGALDSQGNAYVVGWVDFATTNTILQFGNLNLAAKHAGFSSCVVKLDPTDGHALWVDSFDTASGTSICWAVATNGSSGVAVACTTSGDIAYTDTSNVSHVATHTGGSTDIFVAELDPTSGKVAKSLYLPGAASEQVTKLSYDKTGNLHVAGVLAAATMTAHIPANNNANAFTVTRKGSGTNTYDAFVLKLAAADWSHIYDVVWGTPTAWTFATGGAVAPNGNYYATGYFTKTRDFGQGPLTAIGQSDAFVVELDPSGKSLASTNFGGSNAGVSPVGVAVDAVGNVVVAGHYNGISANIKIGSTTLPTSNNGEWAEFTAKFGSDLTSVAWAKSESCPTCNTTSSGLDSSGMDVDRLSGNIATTGSLIGKTDLGDGKQVTRANGWYLVRRSQ